VPSIAQKCSSIEFSILSDAPDHEDAMPVAKQRRSDAASGLTFINVSHPDEIRQKSTQRTIRSGAMAAIGRTRRKRPEKPIVVEIDMLPIAGHDKDTADGSGTSVLAALRLHSAFTASQNIPMALPHLGIFAVEPNNRARELFHFSMWESGYSHMSCLC
jgi:hypothetical protein